MSPTPSIPFERCPHGSFVCSLCAAEASTPVTFRVIHFQPADRFMAMAWDDAKGIFLATSDCVSYVEARKALDVEARNAGVSLRWFEGCYSARVTDSGLEMSRELSSPMAEGLGLGVRSAAV